MEEGSRRVDRRLETLGQPPTDLPRHAKSAIARGMRASSAWSARSPDRPPRRSMEHVVLKLGREAGAAPQLCARFRQGQSVTV